jgi:hypothetical protein
MKFLVVYCTYMPAVCDVFVLDCVVCSVFRYICVLFIALSDYCDKNWNLVVVWLVGWVAQSV